MNEKILNILGIIAIIVIVINLGILLLKADEVKAVLTGKVSQGEVNITVGEYTSLNFTTWQINFGTGSVDAGETNASLMTDGTIDRGNWTAVEDGLRIENTGNINLSILIKADETASSFLGGTNPKYAWNFSDDDADDGSCIPPESTDLSTEWYDVNATMGVCDYFQPNDAIDEMDIDFWLIVPSDSLTEARGDQITATVNAV